MTPIDDLSRLCRTLRPAPSAGCFVSRLNVSSESQITLHHRAFRTVAAAPSSRWRNGPSFLCLRHDSRWAVMPPSKDTDCEKACGTHREGGHPDVDQTRETLLSW